ncbi:ABC transporter permease [Brevibacillus centrosporus]|uniref:NitT/TauT family transport system permease protein n=1 Tax=Brevibacillus centrosporus TaxID=54910 RepID=A0A1I4CRM2_9BACL|nr:ABC transporter permease [Brevibacillus centrosporus]MED4911923.1 ABC transporter permease [Brevibacillus centrosporus]SFK83908.1 NitT/TauT family transport system permease protein [Brevibacillus centrosporus]
MKKGWNIIVQYQSLIWIVVAWEIIAFMQVMPERLFPSLGKVVVVAIDLISSGMLMENLPTTLFRVFAGFALAAVVGVPLGLLMSRSAKLNDVMQPMFSLGYPIPRVALYPILVFILGLGSASKVSLIFIECLFPIVLNTYYGATRVGKIYLWAGQNMGASSSQIFWRILLPATMPTIFTGLKIALPLAFIIAVLTEMIGSTVGMGYLLSYMSASLMQEKVLACVLLITLVGYLLNLLLQVIQKKYVFWQ